MREARKSQLSLSESREAAATLTTLLIVQHLTLHFSSRIITEGVQSMMSCVWFQILVRVALVLVMLLLAQAAGTMSHDERGEPMPYFIFVEKTLTYMTKMTQPNHP